MTLHPGHTLKSLGSFQKISMPGHYPISIKSVTGDGTQIYNFKAPQVILRSVGNTEERTNHIPAKGIMFIESETRLLCLFMFVHNYTV